MYVCSIHNILWLSVVRLEHIFCGKHTWFCLFLNFLPACFMPCLLIFVLEKVVKRRIHVLLCGLQVHSLLFYLLSLACNFSEGIWKEVTQFSSLFLLFSLHLLQVCS